MLKGQGDCIGVVVVFTSSAAAAVSGAEQATTRHLFARQGDKEREEVDMSREQQQQSRGV